jgi:GxxExxY protein
MKPAGWAYSDEMKRAANELSREVIGAAIEVHRHTGPGMLEEAYEECLCHELVIRNIPFLRQHPVCIDYKGKVIDSAYKIDILVDDLVIIELKSVKELADVHEAQLMTYLRLHHRWLGLLMNFNVPVLRDGILRRVLGG